MLVLKNEMDLYDFKNEFWDELKDLPDEAIVIIFDSLCEMMFEGDYSITHVRDYIRFQMRVPSLDEVIGDYSIDIDAEDDADAKIETVEKYLNYNSPYNQKATQ